MSSDADGGDWFASLHTAEDIAAARRVLMTWAEQTCDDDATASMAARITARAVQLGLEPA